MDSHLILVWGAGGHGRVVADVARAAGSKVLGYIDRDPARTGAPVDGAVGVVLAEADLLAGLSDQRPLAHGATAIALGIGDNRRRAACRAALSPGLLPPLVHPSAIVSPSATIGAGAVVMPACVINAGADIGAGTIVNTAAVVEHDCVVGPDTHISPGAVLAGGVRVGQGAWIGAGATVIPGVRIGDWAVVGAGATVVRDVQSAVTVVGTPAKPIRSQTD